MAATGFLSPIGLILQAFSDQGVVAAGYKVNTYLAGSSTPTPTFTDSTLTTPNANPIVLQPNGRLPASVWAPSGTQIKMVLTDAAGALIPNGTIDNLPLINDVFGSLYKRTPAEIAGGIFPVDFTFPAYFPDRYETNTVPGTTDMFTGIQTADTAANLASAAVTFVPGEIYGVNNTAHANQIQVTSNWVCNGPKAILRRLDFNATVAYFIARADNQNGLTMRGLLFDGQVTTIAAGTTPNVDLAAAGAYGDNHTESLWAKPYGVRFYNCQECVIENCTFQNFLRAGLRVDGDGVATGAPWAQTIARNNRISKCTTIRTRGCFGDGFYSASCEGVFFTECTAYDYQRIGFVDEVSPLGATQASSHDPQYVNCISDYGHDAVNPENNVGFWNESADGVHYTGCVAKNTSIGWNFGASIDSTATGVYRAYTASQSMVGCKGIRLKHAGVNAFYGGRGVHLTIDDCFFEVNLGAAAYSYSFGGPAAGVTVGFTEDGTHQSVKVDISNTSFDMVGFGASGLTQASCVHMSQGKVTSGYQLQVNMHKLGFRWLTAAGAIDTGAQTIYESTTAPNYGYFADIVFSGLNDSIPDLRFQGRAKITECSNESFGYVMMSSEIAGAQSVLEIANTRISMRTGGATTNNGVLIMNDCQQVDLRGQVGWTYAQISNSGFIDLGFSTDRTAWNCGNLKLNNCFLQRQLWMDFNGNGGSANRPLRLQATGCEWFVSFNNESGLKINCAVANSIVEMGMSGSIFRNNGTGAMTATKSMIECNVAATVTIQVSGAGNGYDNAMVGGGGHVFKVNTTPTYNDAPGVVAGPFLSVNGALQQFGPI